MDQKVLIVEDQAEIRHLIRVTLSVGQYEVYEADNGVAGLALAKSIKPDLVLLDVMI